MFKKKSKKGNLRKQNYIREETLPLDESPVDQISGAFNSAHTRRTKVRSSVIGGDSKSKQVSRDEINLARKKRDFSQEIHEIEKLNKNYEENFIGLDENGPDECRDNNFSRLPREDDELEDKCDAFDDYNQASLAFGTKAIVNLLDKERNEISENFQDVLNNDLLEENDEGLMEWEQEQMMKGANFRSDSSFYIKRFSKKLNALHEISDLESFRDLSAELLFLRKSIVQEIAQDTFHLESLASKQSDYQKSIEYSKNSLDKTSSNYEYMRNTLQWISFRLQRNSELNVKFLQFQERVFFSLQNKVESVEKLLTGLHCQYIREMGIEIPSFDSEIQSKDLDIPREYGLGGKFDTFDLMMSNLETLNFDENNMLWETILNDSNSVFRKLAEWKLSNSSTYDDLSVDKYVPELVDPFLRLSLMKEWHILDGTEYQDLEKLSWNVNLLKFFESTNNEETMEGLVHNMVKLKVIPFLKALISPSNEKRIFSIHSSQNCRNLCLAILNVGDYLSDEDLMSCQSDLVKSFVEVFLQQLEAIYHRRKFPNIYFNRFDSMTRNFRGMKWCLGGLLEIIRNVNLIHNFLGDALTQFHADFQKQLMALIQNPLLPLLNVYSSYDDNLEQYLSILSDFIQNSLRWLECSILLKPLIEASVVRVQSLDDEQLRGNYESKINDLLQSISENDNS